MFFIDYFTMLHTKHLFKTARKHVFLGLTRFLSFSPWQRCVVTVTNDNSARRLDRPVCLLCHLAGDNAITRDKPNDNSSVFKMKPKVDSRSQFLVPSFFLWRILHKNPLNKSPKTAIAHCVLLDSNLLSSI